MEFQELFSLLNRKKLILILVPMISAALAFFFRFTSDRIYTSESQISTGLTMGVDFTGEKNQVSPFEMTLNFNNLTANMASKMVVNRLGCKLLYHDLSNADPFRRPNFEKIEIVYPDETRLTEILDVLSQSIQDFKLINRDDELGRYIYKLLDAYEYSEFPILDNGSISRVGQTDFINIRFSSEVPKLSAYVVNEWALSFIEYYEFQKTSRLNESLSVLSQILKDKQRLLDERTAELARYNSRHVLSGTNDEISPVTELERSIREKESSLRSLNIRLQDIRDRISQQDKSSSFNSRKRIIKIKNQMDLISNKLITDSRNKMLLDSMEYYRKELQNEMYLHISSSQDKDKLEELFKLESDLELQYKIALTDLEELRGSYFQEKGVVRSMASSKSNLVNLQKEVEQARTEFIASQDKYNNARSRLLVGSSSIKLSYYGDVPTESQSRKTVIFTGLGFAVGLMLTLFVVLALEILDLRIKNPLKFRRCTGFEPTGTIVHMNGLNNQLATVLLGVLSGVSKEQETDFLQTLRKMRFELQRNEGGIIMFTSLREGTGKTFLLTSFAFSLALINKKVLIIDTNFRNNTLTNKLLDGQEEAMQNSGLNVVLSSGEIQVFDKKTSPDMDDFIDHKIVMETHNPFIHLMKSHNIQQSPEEIFSRADFGKLLSAFRKEYDYILIEGAALNNYSDSKELSLYADHIVAIFSVKDEFTNKDKKSLQFLMENESKLSLKLLNNVEPQDAE